jgi:predicted RNase H-like HicB family nuclease
VTSIAFNRGAYLAQVPDLPGCLAHGETQDAALASARSAIDLYLDNLRECGEALPEPRRYRVLSA